MRKIFFLMIFICTIYIGGIATAKWFSPPDNFDDCVLKKMKGQDASLRIYAINACRRLFPKIEKIELFSLFSKTSWGQTKSGLRFSIEENHSQYIITKIDAVFSEKNCDETKPEDYNFSASFVFDDNKKNSSIRLKMNKEYRCMKIVAAWGYMGNESK